MKYLIDLRYLTLLIFLSCSLNQAKAIEPPVREAYFFKVKKRTSWLPYFSRLPYLETWKVNDDNETVTLIEQSVDTISDPSIKIRKISFLLPALCNPVTDPNTGKSYVITGIGDGEHAISNYSSSDKPVTPITPNILRIEDYALRFDYEPRATAHIYIPEGNNLEYIGKDSFYRAYWLWINSDCELHSIGCAPPYFLHLDNVTELGDDGCSLFKSGLNQWDYVPRYNTNIIEVNCQIPPTVHGVIYDDGDDDIYDTAKLYVPVGTIDAYRSHPEWGKFKNIYEKDFDQ